MTLKLILGILLALFFSKTSLGSSDIISHGCGFLNEQVFVFKDVDKAYNTSNINQAKFTATNHNSLNYGLTRARIWVQFSIPSKDTNERILEFRNSQIDEIVLYTLQNNKWVKINRTGDTFPYSKRKMPHRFFHLAIHPNQKYLVRIHGKGGPLNLKMSSFTQEALAEHDYIRLFSSGIYLSILFFVLLLNLVISILFREKRNLYFLGYLSTMVLLQLTFTGHGAEQIWGEYPYIQNKMTVWCGAMSLILLSSFAKTFLNLPIIAPKVTQLLNIVVGLMVLAILLSFFSSSDIHFTAIILVNLISFFTIFIILAGAIASYKSGFKAALLVVISKIGMLVALFVFVLGNFGYLESMNLTDISLQISILAEAILLTLALISSFTLYENESIEYLKKISHFRLLQNEQLASKIDIRTKEIQEQKSQLEQKNAENVSSITYAVRIQKVLMPTEQKFFEGFKSGFIYYQPKEIVSGDFYWKSVIPFTSKDGSKQQLDIIFTGDSNSFGVPGALLGILYMRIVQKAIARAEINSPEKALKYLRTEIQQTFSNTENPMNHKLSCSICVINKADQTLEFSGAKSSILLLQNKEITEIFGDDQYIEGGTEETNFTYHQLTFKPGNTLILSTDGIQKQCFETDKSLCLKSIVNKLISEEGTLNKPEFSAEINKFIKNDEQIDDLTVIAVTY